MQVQEAATLLQASVFPEIDALVGANIQRVQRAFKKARIGPHHFAGSTGYGHGDLGRAAFDEVSALHLCLIAALHFRPCCISEAPEIQQQKLKAGQPQA